MRFDAKVAEKMITDGKLEATVKQRYAGWEREPGQKILEGNTSLADLPKLALDSDPEPCSKSGQQERSRT
jgi:xylose isomerase